MRLLAESSGFGRWRRRATGVVDRWSPSREGYRTRLTVRPRPTLVLPAKRGEDTEAMRSVIAVAVALIVGTAAGATTLATIVESASSACRRCSGTICNLEFCYVFIDRDYVTALAVLVGLAFTGIALVLVRSFARRRRKVATSSG